jgi:hypothetical protein
MEELKIVGEFQDDLPPGRLLNTGWTGQSGSFRNCLVVKETSVAKLLQSLYSFRNRENISCSRNR